MTNPKAVAIIGSADGPTDIIISPKNEVIITEIEGVTLYANGTKEDIYEGITVQTKDTSNSFSWVNVTNPTYAPTINVIDVDNDGKEEIIIILVTDYGTGVLHQEIHILNMEDLSEVNIQYPIEVINKK